MSMPTEKSERFKAILSKTDVEELLASLDDPDQLQARVEELLTAEPEIDLEALADQVYALIKKDIRLEMERR